MFTAAFLAGAPEKKFGLSQGMAPFFTAPEGRTAPGFASAALKVLPMAERC